MKIGVAIQYAEMGQERPRRNSQYAISEGTTTAAAQRFSFRRYGDVAASPSAKAGDANLVNTLGYPKRIADPAPFHRARVPGEESIMMPMTRDAVQTGHQ